MAKNTGKPSESDWEEAHDRLGKRAFYCRLVDAAEIYGRTGVKSKARAQPSDYIATLDGTTFFAEVKSSIHQNLFEFKLLRTAQSAAAQRVLSAGGEYWVYAHCLAHNIWFRFSYALVEATKATGRSSIPWTQLEGHEWNPNSLT